MNIVKNKICKDKFFVIGFFDNRCQPT